MCLPVVVVVVDYNDVTLLFLMPVKADQCNIRTSIFVVVANVFNACRRRSTHHPST